jgi:hypothetical protein
MPDYVVAIPSYKRQDILIQKTLAMLKQGKVSSSVIHIFVANEEEKGAYEKAVPKDLYFKIIVGVVGITNQRRFIVEYFKENQYVVSIDDDVERIEKMNGPTKLVKISNVDRFFRTAYSDIVKKDLHIWGIYPVRNPFFMKPKVTTDLKFIIGTMYGFINRHDKGLQPSSSIKEKEDYEQSILYFLKDGGVLRYNNITIKTKFHGEGGLGKVEGRFENNKKAAEYLNKKYPDLVSVFHRKNGMSEVRLRRTMGKPEATGKAKPSYVGKPSKKNKTMKKAK